MKAILFFLLASVVVVACDSTNDEKIKTAEIERINSKLIKLESKLRSFDVHQPLTESYYDSLARVYFDLIKHDKDMVGFYLHTPFNTYCSKNFMAWEVKAEREEIVTDSSLFKCMRRADVYHSGKVNPTKKTVSVGAPHSNYQKTTKDVMYVNYALELEMLDLQLFYKLSKPYPAKFDNGNYGTAGTMKAYGDYVILE